MRGTAFALLARARASCETHYALRTTHGQCAWAVDGTSTALVAVRARTSTDAGRARERQNARKRADMSALLHAHALIVVWLARCWSEVRGMHNVEADVVLDSVS